MVYCPVPFIFPRIFGPGECDLFLRKLEKKSCYFSTGEVLKNLNKFYKRKEIQRLGAENGLDGKKMF